MIHRSTVIESLGVYLPPRAVLTSDILKACKSKVRIPFELLTGVHSRRMAGETEFAIDLAEKAILDCLMHSRHSAAEIEILISANISRYDRADFGCFYEPSTAIRLKNKIGLPNALTFDLNCACAGMFAAIHVIDAMIRAGFVRRGMVVSGEYITHLTRTAQKEIEDYLDERLACLTLGDAGAAVILEAASSDKVGFKDLTLQTLGEYSSFCIAKPTDREHGGAIMHTDMVNLTALGVKHTVSTCATVMKRCGWDAGEIRHILVHQTSKRSIDAAARELQRLLGRTLWSRSKMINNLAERGNTASTSHFVALGDSIRAGAIAAGDKAMFGIVGSGLTVGAGLYTFDDLPDRLRSLIATPVTPRPSATADRGRYFSQDGLRRMRVEALGTCCHAIGEKANSLELLVRAVRNCLRASSRSIDDIDLLIHSGVYRSDFIGEPAIAALLAGKLGFRPASLTSDHVFALDVMNGALGSFNACFSASALLQTGRYRRALVVAAEIENNAGMASAPLRGIRESASAILLDLNERSRQGFGSFLFRDSLTHVDSFCAHLAQSDGTTSMSFRRNATLDAGYLACVEETFHDLLGRAGLSPRDLAAVLPPQISPGFVSALRERLPVPAEVVINTAVEGEDLFTSSLAYSLQELQRTRPPNPGDIAMIISVGTGIQTGAALYHF